MQTKRTITGVASAVAATFGVGMITGVFAAPAFSDVPPSFWGYNDINWAAANGLMNGPGNMPGRFDPAGVVNRAQLAAVLARYDALIRDHIDVLNDRVGDLEDDWDDMHRSSSSRSSLSSSRSSLSSSRSSSSLSSSSVSSSMSSSSMSSSSLSSSSLSSSSLSSSSSSASSI